MGHFMSVMPERANNYLLSRATSKLPRPLLHSTEQSARTLRCKFVRAVMICTNSKGSRLHFGRQLRNRSESTVMPRSAQRLADRLETHRSQHNSQPIIYGYAAVNGDFFGPTFRPIRPIFRWKMAKSTRPAAGE